VILNRVYVFLLLMILSLNVISAEGVTEDNLCPDGEVFSSKMMTSICWSCLLPMSVFSVIEIGPGKGPEDKYDGFPICTCTDGNGAISTGAAAGFWTPTRIYEIVKTPLCSPTLGGVILSGDASDDGLINMEGRRPPLGVDITQKVKYHVHGFEFPIMAQMGFITDFNCLHDGWTKFDMTLAPTEFIPNWNDEELGLLLAAEAMIFGNELAQLACGTDCLASMVSEPINSMFWCAGCWGINYPMAGIITDPIDAIVDSSLLMSRYMALNHRLGALKDTVGEDAMCGGNYAYTIPKSQYRASMIFPVPEADDAGESAVGTCCHNMGENHLSWGLRRKIPGIGEDFLYLVYQYRDCCVL
jgi:conjugal transfer pilus assembly protein TraU